MTLTTITLSFLFQMSMARQLSIADFGLLNTLIALFAVVNFTSKVNQTLVAKLVIEREPISLVDLYLAFFKFALVVVLFFVLAIPFISQFLHLKSWMPLVPVAGLIFVTILLSVTLGALQGFHRFSAFGSNQILQQGLRLALAMSFVNLGLGVEGALLGILLSSVLGLGSGILSLAQVQKSKGGSYSISLGEICSEGRGLSLAVFIIYLFTYVDLLFAQRYLPPDVAGKYAGIAAIGKMLFYLPDCILSVFFPMVTKMNRDKQCPDSLMLKALLGTLVLVLPVVACFWIFGRPIMGILGSGFSEHAELLGPYCLAMVCVALGKIPINLLMAQGRYRFLVSFVIILLTQLLGLSLFHGSIQAMVYMVLCSSLAFLVMSFVEMGVKRPDLDLLKPLASPQ